ncbi:MAG: hypothetical protein OSA99_19670, partial [Acidimicrobiales bacterium]|nr:hypothetical protein [Acidimicrobiales bacterium]
RVDTDALRAAATDVAAATRAMGVARGALEAAATWASSGLDHRGDAAHKVSTFARQWRSEFDLVSTMVDAFHDILHAAADCYVELDGGVARCLVEAGG